MMTIEDHSFVTTLVGGDQLTTARALVLCLFGKTAIWEKIVWMGSYQSLKIGMRNFA